MSAYIQFPGLQAANGCLAVGCTACCEGPGNPRVQARGVPAQKPHAARIQRADVVARWEDFERAQAAEEGEGETYSVTQIRSAFAKHASPDDWGVESFYVGVLISALRGEYEEDS